LDWFSRGLSVSGGPPPGVRVPLLEINIEKIDECLNCTARCFLKIGADEIVSQIIIRLALAAAKKIAWETGKQVIPIAGPLSSLYSATQALICVIECN